MGSFSIWHWLIVLLIVVMIFGTKKLRNIGGDLGSAVKEFKEGMKNNEADPDAPAGQVTNNTTTTAREETIDVEATEKS